MFDGCLFFLSRLCQLLKLSYPLAEINIIQNPRQLLSDPGDAFTAVAEHGRHVLTSTLCNSTDDAAQLLGISFPLQAVEVSQGSLSTTPSGMMPESCCFTLAEMCMKFDLMAVVTKNWKQTWRSLAPTFSI